MPPSFARRSLLMSLGAAAGAASALALRPAQAADSPEEERLHTDWPYLARYRDENLLLTATGEQVDAVFLGDSITEGWLSKAPAFFTSGRVCRGIAGQTTPQMLLRFRQDVIDLKPRIVHIMAGTNDMTEIAIANGVHLVFASIPPASDYPWRPGLDTVTPIAALNAWLKNHARRIQATYADYFSALSDGNASMRDGLSSDHVHPTAAGYALMRPVAEAALRQAARARR
jgi:hypothetical protein